MSIHQRRNNSHLHAAVEMAKDMTVIDHDEDTDLVNWSKQKGKIEGAKSKVEEEQHLRIYAEQEGRQLSAEESKRHGEIEFISVARMK